MIQQLSYFSKPSSKKNNLSQTNWQTLLPKLQLEEVHLFSNLPYLTAECGISCHENLIKIKCGERNSFSREMPKRKKNDIVNFSNNSRRRMIKDLSTVNLSKYEIPLFVTTTFQNVYPQDSEALKTLFRNYLKKIRRVEPNIQWTWRLEWQKRKAPHFHIIFYPPLGLSAQKYNAIKRQCSVKWWSMLEDHNFYTWKYSVKIIALKEKKKLYQYISKYNAKADTTNNSDYVGQRHGSSSNLNYTARQEVVTSQEFIVHFKNIIWKHISSKFEKFEDFYKTFFANGEISLLMSMDQQRLIFTEAINSFAPL